MARATSLSVIIPVFNEETTILQVLAAVKKATPKSKEVIVVDDASSDHTYQLLKKNSHLYTVLVKHPRNKGKGAAVRTGFNKARGEIVIVQDADLEYDPQEYSALISPILSGQADAVYGSRFVGTKPHRVMYYWHFLANRILTTLCNITTNLNLTDMETGYKAIKREMLERIELHENDFGFEPEITIKLAQNQARLYEVGIAYHGRIYSEGKKIQWTDAFKAVWVIFKYGWLTKVGKWLTQV